MVWILFAIGAALCWGVYGPALHKGQTLLGNPLKALFCVGIAYMVIGVLVPLLGLGQVGDGVCRAWSYRRVVRGSACPMAFWRSRSGLPASR